MQFLDLFLVSFMVTLLLTPVVRKLAFRVGAVDKPNKRKVHRAPVPRIGGVAIFIGFLAALLIAGPEQKVIWGVIAGASILFVAGLFDDLLPKGLKAPVKLAVQVLAAWLVVHYFEVRIAFFSSPVDEGLMPLGWFSEPLSIIWIVGITNTMNLIDGLDGLAAGVGSIAAFTLFITALALGRDQAAILLIALFGAALGFLPYNFSPASIFMGDAGSTLLGYILAVASIIGVLKSSASLALSVPIFVLGIPIFDTLAAIIRRLKRGQHIFKPDGEHFHHRLLISGLSHKQAVLFIYYASMLLSLAGLLIAIIQGPWLVVIFIVICFLIFMGALVIKNRILL
jgi:UDP-GlcNAc:undecaprenyl-phosphate GlcNAc-1-phosphate transferase